MTAQSASEEDAIDSHDFGQEAHGDRVHQSCNHQSSAEELHLEDRVDVLLLSYGHDFGEKAHENARHGADGGDVERKHEGCPTSLIGMWDGRAKEHNGA